MLLPPFSALNVRETAIFENEGRQKTSRPQIVGPLVNGDGIGTSHAPAGKRALVMAAVREVGLAAASHHIDFVHAVLELVELAGAVAGSARGEAVLTGFDALQSAVQEMQVAQQLGRSEVVRPDFVLRPMWQKETIATVMPRLVIFVAPPWLAAAKPNVGLFHAGIDQLGTAAQRVRLRRRRDDKQAAGRNKKRDRADDSA